jgi:hypothetical protein
LNFERCFTEAGVDPTPSILSGFADHCFPRLCAPSGMGVTLGVNQQAEWFDACDASGTEGICFGAVDTNSLTGDFGVCYPTGGDVAPGGACDGNSLFGDTANQCASSVCIAGTCALTCSATAQDCPEGAGLACASLETLGAGLNADNGICVPADG